MDPTDLLEKYAGRDKLEAIFELVEQGNDTWPEDDLNIRETQKNWKEVLFCLTEELNEAVDAIDGDSPVTAEFEATVQKLTHSMFKAANCLKVRPWVKTEYQTDYAHLYDELADSIWFFIALLRLSQLTPEKTFDIFVRKFKVNQFRKVSQY